MLNLLLTEQLLLKITLKTEYMKHIKGSGGTYYEMSTTLLLL